MKKIVCVIVLLCLFLLSVTAVADMSISFLDLGEVKCTWISCDGKEMLIDTGAEDDANTLNSFLSGRGNHVDYLCLTKDDEEHAGGTVQFLEAYEVGTVYAPSKAWVDEAQIPSDGESFLLGSSIVRIIRKDDALEYVIEDTGKTISVAADAALSNGKTNTKAVNVRQKASASSDKVAKLEKGTVFLILGTMAAKDGTSWYQVQLADGSIGYIRGDLVEITQEAFSTETKVVKAIAEKVSNGKKETASSGSGQYIGNKNSKIYHRSSCSTLPKSSNRVYFDSKSAAQSAGYRGCKKCKP